MNITYEWDDRKANNNLRKHGVSFEAAKLAFDDFRSLGWQDINEAYGEDRFIHVGMAAGRLLFVVYTEHEDRIRIISARGALKHEQQEYFRQNAQEEW
ncbi:MAG: BrnT family toxin [Alphaproteobacteria bacterium]